MSRLRKEIKISDDCSDSEQRQLLDSLVEHEQVFALCDEELGETDVIEHSRDTADANDVRKAPRRLPYALRKQLEEELDKQLKSIVWNWKIVPLLHQYKKKDGTLQLCADY